MIDRGSRTTSTSPDSKNTPHKRLDDKRAVNVILLVYSVGLRPVAPIGAGMIATNAIGARINDVQQASFQGHELSRIYLTLAHGTAPDWREQDIPWVEIVLMGSEK